MASSRAWENEIGYGGVVEAFYGPSIETERSNKLDEDWSGVVRITDRGPKRRDYAGHAAGADALEVAT